MRVSSCKRGGSRASIRERSATCTKHSRDLESVRDENEGIIATKNVLFLFGSNHSSKCGTILVRCQRCLRVLERRSLCRSSAPLHGGTLNSCRGRANHARRLRKPRASPSRRRVLASVAPRASPSRRRCTPIVFPTPWGMWALDRSQKCDGAQLLGAGFRSKWNS